MENTKKKENEWLQFLEIIKRKYGYNTYNIIYKYYYKRRGNESVASYFKKKLPSSTFTSNASIKSILENKDFMQTLFRYNLDPDIKQFTKTYSETDSLIKEINNEDENMYIKCNPVDDNGEVIDSTNNNLGANANSVNSILEEMNSMFKPEMLYNNIGLQVSMAIGFLFIIYSIGNYLFVQYPKNVIAKRLN